MSVDFPRAWEISREGTAEDHDPGCSYRRFAGGFLCDCRVLAEHPETVAEGAFYGAGGRVLSHRSEAPRAAGPPI